ncbi:MAG: class I SAM-dependent methyltransferase, partial [Rhodocyclaceae bacterium]
MNSSSLPARSANDVSARNVPAVARPALRCLQTIEHGSLSLTLPDGSVSRFGVEGGAHANLRLNNWRLFAEVLKSGDIGMAESFFRGDWSTPDLAQLLTLLLRNRVHLESLIHGSWWGGLIYRLRHRFNRNSRANSRKNIHAHYDLGNAFYALWLDPTHNYSSAWFESPDLNMEAAQHAKVRRALAMAGVRAGDRVLEIGCGWGALAEKAALEFEANVVGVTLSTEQLAYARER